MHARQSALEPKDVSICASPWVHSQCQRSHTNVASMHLWRPISAWHNCARGAVSSRVGCTSSPRDEVVVGGRRRARGAKVGDAHAPVRAHQQVVRLEVPVHDARHVVEVRHALHAVALALAPVHAAARGSSCSAMVWC